MTKKNIRKYGLQINEIKKEDYVFGSVFSPVPFEELVPDGDWTPWLPTREEQNLNGIETYACVSFTILTAIEILIKRKYGEERNYSDRFLATVSGTKEGGNSPQNVCEFLRKIGVVSEELLPFSSDIDTFDKFYAPISPKLHELAREFNEEWDFKHEYVPSTEEAMLKAIKCSPLGLSVAAWHERGSKYYKPENKKDNHFTTGIKLIKGECKRVLDSYADGEGDPFLKDYEWETKHSVIKRFWIQKKNKKKSWLQNVIYLILKTIKYER